MNDINVNRLRNKGKTVLQLITQLKNWPTFLYDVARKQRTAPGKLVRYRYRNSLVMTVRALTDDKWALTEVLMKRPYDHPQFHPLGSSPIIVDLGAHVGSFTVSTAYQLPHARIFAMEAAAATYELLQTNVAQNQLKNVTTIHGAIAREAGQVAFRVDPSRSVFSSTLATAGNKSGSIEEVSAWTLEKLMETYHLTRIDFLKCDIEGSEFDVFLNLPATIWARLQNVSLEYHLFQKGQTGYKLRQVFLDHGFDILEFTPARPDVGMLKAKRRFP